MVRVGHFSIPPTMNVTPKNEKLDLGILQHVENFKGHFQHTPNQACHTLGLGLSVFHSDG